MTDLPLGLLLALAACCLLSGLHFRRQLPLGHWSRLAGAPATAEGAEGWRAPRAPRPPPSPRHRRGRRGRRGHRRAPGATAEGAAAGATPVADPAAAAAAPAAAAPAALTLAPPRALALAPSKVQWLHVPKCGTSFVYVLVAWACPSARPPECELSFGSVGKVCQELRHLDCARHWVLDRSARRFQAKQGSLVSVFRNPGQRMISHYYYRVVRKKLHMSWPEFIRDVEGCQAKALIGYDCDMPHRLTDSDIREAVRRVRVGFAFVGILEEWAQMVCLFHKMLGGSCRADEATHFRQGLKRRSGGIDSDGNYNISVLNGYVDKADTRVYDAAKEVFDDNVREYGGIPSPAGCEAFCS